MKIPMGREHAIMQAITDLQAAQDAPITNDMIAEYTGYSRATVKRTIASLLSWQAIDREQVTTPGIPGYRYRYEVFNGELSSRAG